MKLASMEDFMSIAYLLRLFCVILAMSTYAIFWQVLLKKVPLTQAFLFKSITVLFTLFFAFSIFKESISLNNIIGALFIIAGIIVNSR